MLEQVVDATGKARHAVTSFADATWSAVTVVYTTAAAAGTEAQKASWSGAVCHSGANRREVE